MLYLREGVHYMEIILFQHMVKAGLMYTHSKLTMSISRYAIPGIYIYVIKAYLYPRAVILNIF